jgi:hypothetical protein
MSFQLFALGDIGCDNIPDDQMTGALERVPLSPFLDK